MSLQTVSLDYYLGDMRPLDVARYFLMYENWVDVINAATYQFCDWDHFKLESNQAEVREIAQRTLGLIGHIDDEHHIPERFSQWIEAQGW